LGSPEIRPRHSGNHRSTAKIGGSKQLHSAWDSEIIKASNRSVSALVNAANAWLATQDE
jgi:hypothetical protein